MTYMYYLYNEILFLVPDDKFVSPHGERPDKVLSYTYDRFIDCYISNTGSRNEFGGFTVVDLNNNLHFCRIAKSGYCVAAMQIVTLEIAQWNKRQSYG